MDREGWKGYPEQGVGRGGQDMMDRDEGETDRPGLDWQWSRLTERAETSWSRIG